MNSFDDRKNVSEKKFVLEAQQVFKADARRNKLLALWVSELLGKSDDEAKLYVGEVIAADMEEAGDDDVFRKLRKDLDAAGIDISDVTLREKMDAFTITARQQILDET